MSSWCLKVVAVNVQTTRISSLFCRDRQATGKTNRKLEKKMKEVQLQAEDEKRHAEQYKDQVEWCKFDVADIMKTELVTLIYI